MSEQRISRYMYCVNCWETVLTQQPNNNKAWDFFCATCKTEFELKSKKDTLGWKINDWAYSSMIDKIENNLQPNFFFLSYTWSYTIKDLLLLPKHFFTQEIIEKRAPLAAQAQRAGRIWCNILFSNLPETWKIYIVKNGQVKDKKEVKEQWKKWTFLEKQTLLTSKWRILDTMKCIDKIPDKEFSLRQLYAFEPELSQKYTNNEHIKDKLRQQLQLLRDKWIIQFLSKSWNYRKLY